MEHICLDFLRNLLQYPWEDFPFVVQAAKISCHYMSMMSLDNKEYQIMVYLYQTHSILENVPRSQET
jgi:hypothetical protein